MVPVGVAVGLKSCEKTRNMDQNRIEWKKIISINHNGEGMMIHLYKEEK